MVRVYREAVSCHKFNTLHQRIEGECVMLGQGKNAHECMCKHNHHF